MDDEIKNEFKVGGKNITVIYDLSLYSEKDYRLDFKDFLDYQTKKEFSAYKTDEEKENALDWKFYNVKELRFIPFNDFLNIVSNLLSKVVYQILRDDPSIMVSEENEFKVRFIIFRVPGRDWYFEDNPREVLKDEGYSQLLDELESETVENHYYLTAGVFLIQAIAAPWYYKKRIDYSYAYRFLVHELEHHKQKMIEYFNFEDEVEKRLKERSKIKIQWIKIKIPWIMNYRIKYLFLTMSWLFKEGIADFVTMTNKPKIDIHMDWIYKFRKDLDALTTMRGKSKIKKFWDDNLYYGTFQGGAYYCGKIMCFTIELAFAKRMKKPPFSINIRDSKTYNLDEIDKVMSSQEIFYVDNPDYSVFKKTYEELTKYNYDYRKFIALYEWACKDLGIRKRNMVIWYGLFDDLKKKATKFYGEYSKEKRAEAYKKIKEIVRAKYSVG